MNIQVHKSKICMLCWTLVTHLVGHKKCKVFYSYTTEEIYIAINFLFITVEINEPVRIVLKENNSWEITSNHEQLKFNALNLQPSALTFLLDCHFTQSENLLQICTRTN